MLGLFNGVKGAEPYHSRDILIPGTEWRVGWNFFDKMINIGGCMLQGFEYHLHFFWGADG